MGCLIPQDFRAEQYFNLSAALDYAERGYRVFPLVRNDKIPLPKSNGVLDATDNADKILQWWSAWPHANIGISTAGLLVIDVDDPNIPDGKLCEILGVEPEDLKPAAVSQTPRGGLHIVFADDEREFHNTAGHLAKGIDTRANGGYIVAPPSIVGGRPYRFFHGFDLPEFSELPPVPDRLARRLRAATATKTPSVDSEGKIREGGRNDYLYRKACNLRGTQGLGEAAILAAIREVNRSQCSPPLDADEVTLIVHSSAKHEAVDLYGADVPDDSDFDDVRRGCIQDPGEFPSEFLSVPGLVGEIANHMVERGHRPQPILALGAACALMSTITGRKVATESNLRTNLYIVGVAASGMGKDIARVVNKELLNDAFGEKMILPESFASAQGVVSAIDGSHCGLFQLDEFGKFLAVLGEAKHPHLFRIVEVLLRLYSSSNSIYISDAMADANRVRRIREPHAVLYGTTVPKSMFSNLAPESVSDGFLGRLSFFPGDDDVEKREPLVNVVPVDLVERVKKWVAYRPGGNLDAEHAHPYRLGITLEARRVFGEFDKAFDEYGKADKAGCGAIWYRTMEKAQKFAMLHACSRADDPGEAIPAIDADAANWGCRLAEWQTHWLTYQVQNHIAASPYEAKCQKVLAALRDLRADKEPIPLSALARACRSIPSRERKEILDDLVERRETVVEKTKTNGRERTAIRLIS